jgi:uncharacterized protein YutE (UPF0331/DUF86 family)
MAIDRLLVTRKFALILRDVKELENVARLDRSAFVADRTHQLVAERLLERIIGRMIDVNYHIITERDGLPPKDFHESFAKLGRLGILSTELAEALAPAAGLRNRLAHEYNEIDYQKLYDALGEARLTIPRYLAAVETWLESLDG